MDRAPLLFGFRGDEFASALLLHVSIQLLADQGHDSKCQHGHSHPKIQCDVEKRDVKRVFTGFVVELQR